VPGRLLQLPPYQNLDEETKVKLDIEKWNKERIRIETEIRAIKASLHTPGHMGSWKEWADLAKLKIEATRMYMLRAELRNRLHMTNTVKYVGDFSGVTKKVVEPYDRAQQKEWVTMGWQEEYLLPEPAALESPTSDPSLQPTG
jgi:hypothetical protein